LVFANQNQIIMTSIVFQRKDIRKLSPEEIQHLINKNKSIYTQFYDAEYVESLESNVFHKINQVYFRAKFIGFDEYPEPMENNKPLIFAGNHSGMAFPWDAMIFGAGLYHITKKDGRSSIRPLTAPMLSETYLMNPYMIPFMWKRAGGIDATSLNFETLMYFNEADLLIYPEGVPGIGKGFDKRYQLQRFSSSFIRMSLKHKTDVIPVATVNAEYINPYSYRSKIVDKIVQKIGIPNLPIGLLTILVVFQPWAFYFALPANLTYVRGKRIKPYEMTDKDFEDLTPEELRVITEKVRIEMQSQLTEAVAKHGQSPYKWGELFKAQLKNIGRFWFFSPPFWSFLFSEHERQFKRFKEDKTPVNMDFGFFGFLLILLRHAFSFFYFLPIIGWIPLFIRGYSKRGWKDK
jgi:1-acyl-sn-glycerol-3-phosphate acyltransferase